MNRAFRLLALLLVAATFAGCTAGVPGATGDPSPTAAQLAAAPPAQAPSPTVAPTSAPPTATAAPAPTTAPVEPTPDIDVVDGDTDTDTDTGAAPAFQAGSGQADRLPPPPPPDDGLSMTIPNEVTKESPIFGDDPNELQVALTFDAGADTGYAAEILDLLAAEGIKASFGMTGKWAEENADLVRRIADEGHMLFNHTYSHNSLIGAGSGTEPMTAEMVLDELQSTEQIVRDLTGYEMKPYFRAPYGEWDVERLGYLYNAGYYLNVYWTCDTRGWAGWTAAEINAYCTVNLKNHEIILLHVGAGGAGAEGDLASLPGMIASFREQGYEFVTVEEMLQPD